MTSRAAIYCRISKDALELGEGVDRQEKDCRALAKANGWEVSDVYIDNDISAAGPVKKERPEWDRLLADADGGKFDRILAYSNSRLTRRLAELETLIQLHERTKVVINTVVSGNDDLSTADGRMVARIKASVDAAEAEKVGERVARAARQRAEKGIPQKGRHRLFGYTRDWEVHPEEAAYVFEAFERRAKGESTTAIAKDFTSRGIQTVAGNVWKSGTLGVTLTKPIYCGLREYRGEIIGPSDVPTLVDKPLWDAAQANLANDKKGTNVRRYLLSGILRCGHCSAGMKGNPANHMYRCADTYGGCGRLSVKIKNADSYVFHAGIMKYAEGVGNATVDPPAKDYTADIEAVDAEIARLQEGFKHEVYTLPEVTPLLRDARDRRLALEEQAARERPKVNMPKIQRQWLDYVKMTLEQKRLFLGEHIDYVIVGPARSRGNQPFDPSRMEVHYTDGTRARIEAEPEEPMPHDEFETPEKP